jgi:two-component sensor histidine kinase
MRLTSNPLWSFILGFSFLICWNSSLAMVAPNPDSVSLKEFNQINTNEGKMNFLFENELPSVYEFIKKHPATYDSFYKNVSNSSNGKLVYQLKLLEGLIFYHQNKFQKAIPIFLNILNQKNYITQNDSVKVIINLKICFSRLLNYPKVLEMHRVLMEMASRNPAIKKRDLGVALSNVYINMGLTNEAIKYLRAEYYDGARNYDEYAEANFYNNLGVIWQKGGRTDSAIYYYKKAQLIINTFLQKDPKNKYCIFFNGLLEGNIGQVLMSKKQFKEAIPLLKKDIECSLNYGNLQNAAISYNELALCYYEIKQYAIAEMFLDSANKIFNEIDSPHEFLRNLKLKGQILFVTGKFKEAAEIIQKYNTLNDSIANKDKELLMLNQQVAFQTNELQQKIEEQEKQIAYKNLQEDKKNIWRIVLIVLSILMFSIIVFGYFSLHKIKKREQLLFEKNEEISHKSEMLSAALKEKELLIKEVHHRVKNNMQIIMSLLKLQAEKINDNNVEVYFTEARNRIQSMALIHEFLYKKDKMDFMLMDEYIKQLISEIQNSYTQPNHLIELHVDLDPILLDFDTSIPLGLIINELVTNAFKHAFPNKVGNVWISFKKIDHNFVLVVKDNGIGTPKNFEEKKENSLGMELIHLLSEQINASIQITHQPGFEAKIIFTAV